MGIIRNPEGKSGASSVKEASIGAKISSAEVPIEFSSTPLHSWRRKDHKILDLFYLLECTI